MDCLQVPQQLGICSLTVLCTQKSSQLETTEIPEPQENLEPMFVLLRHKIIMKTWRKIGFVVLVLLRSSI